MIRSKMYMLTETSKFMMAFVIVTAQDNAIVIDGGRREDIPLLRQYVGGRRISAWFLTHPHMDHIDAFIETVRSGDPAFHIEAVYCNFPPADFVRQHEPAEAHTSDEFDALRPILGDKLHTVEHGHMGVSMDVYFEISPSVCLWPAPDWMYEEPDQRLAYRMYYAGTIRRWMDCIGAEKHIVTKDGTAEIEL